MLTRHPVCETEIVPSLHSNLGVGSAACGGIEAAAVCCGAGACATGFGDKAQSAQESRSNKAKPVRIRVASGKLLQQPIGSRSSRANRQLHAFRLQRRRMIRTSRTLASHGSLIGDAVLQMETKQDATPAHRPRSRRTKGIERYRRSAGGVPAFGKRNKAPGGLVVVGGA
jgi:hypothetical protein